MKVIVFGANGGLGQHVWKGLLAAGHDVVAYVRSPSKLDSADPLFVKLTVVQGDVTKAQDIKEASEGCQVAINCTSPAGGMSTLDLAKAVVPNAAAGGVDKFYMIGGLGALWVPGTNKTTMVQDWDDREAMTKFGMPTKGGPPKEAIQNMTKGHLRSMAFLKESGLSHTYVCPGAMVDAPATESRVVALDEVASPRAFRVTFGNVAQAIVEDIDKGEFLGHRICVADA